MDTVSLVKGEEASLTNLLWSIMYDTGHRVHVYSVTGLPAAKYVHVKVINMVDRWD